ncbi:hypothetical protein SSS_10011 [Sarcoptes scabiei]|nr:hypothetical protein SSS_10011 [Sarcoptes scabiei]
MFSITNHSTQFDFFSPSSSSIVVSSFPLFHCPWCLFVSTSVRDLSKLFLFGISLSLSLSFSLSFMEFASKFVDDVIEGDDHNQVVFIQHNMKPYRFPFNSNADVMSFGGENFKDSSYFLFVLGFEFFRLTFCDISHLVIFCLQI